MLTSVSIRNWQSLRSVDLDLGRFTVIVGASSSGKSAFMRALRAIASTTTGTSAITRGATSTAVSATAPGGRVTLEHSRGTWRYRLLTGSGEHEFTKLNRSVPEQVTAALRIQPAPGNSTSLNFAGQFDRPYLLTESGSAVAATLGALTNVDTIYKAVREANRRKAAAVSQVRIRREDQNRVDAERDRFADLPARLAACEQAETLAEQALSLRNRITWLRTAIDTLEIAEDVLTRATQLPPVPDITPVTQAAARLARFRELLRHTSQAQAEVRQHQQAVDTAAAAEERLADEHRRILVTLGVCPTCEQTVAP